MRIRRLSRQLGYYAFADGFTSGAFSISMPLSCTISVPGFVHHALDWAAEKRVSSSSLMGSGANFQQPNLPEDQDVGTRS